MIKRRLLVTVTALLGGVFLPSADSFGQSGLQPLGSVDGWDVSGMNDHCQAGFKMRSGLTQFSIGISSNGSFMTLQNLGWNLRSNRRNMMRVTGEFDGERAFRTQALVVAMVRAIQIFVDLTDMSEEDFWTRILSADSMRVESRFGSTPSVNVDLSNIAATLPLLRDCSERYLPEMTLPF